MEPLKEERDFFSASVEEWVKTYAGKIALIKGSKLINVFDNESNALSEGVRMFKTDPFLVRKIQLQNIAASVPAYTLGILNGNSTYPVQWSYRSN